MSQEKLIGRAAQKCAKLSPNFADLPYFCGEGGLSGSRDVGWSSCPWSTSSGEPEPLPDSASTRRTASTIQYPAWLCKYHAKTPLSPVVDTTRVRCWYLVLVVWRALSSSKLLRKGSILRPASSSTLPHLPKFFFLHVASSPVQVSSSCSPQESCEHKLRKASSLPSCNDRNWTCTTSLGACPGERNFSREALRSLGIALARVRRRGTRAFALAVAIATSIASDVVSKANLVPWVTVRFPDCVSGLSFGSKGKVTGSRTGFDGRKGKGGASTVVTWL
eukprot:scaffold1298_cov333-Pavlova_lutheri.AAC.4